jgi:photosystem II stability/assembly factor-like uncharacterized protein
VTARHRTAVAVFLAPLTLVCGPRQALLATYAPEPMEWTLVLQRPIPGKYEDMSWPSAKNGWVTTGLGDILHTADSGATWTVQMSKVGAVRSTDFLDEKHGFAGTLNSGKLFTTTDGGETWTDIAPTLPHTAQGFCGMTHVGKDVHIVGRYFSRVTDYFHSPDAGKTWEYQNLSEFAQGLVDVAFVNKDLGFIGGMAKSEPVNTGTATILKTSDGGKHWRTVFTHDGGRGFAWKIWPINATLIYASLQSQDGIYRMAKSTDGGDTWEVVIVAKDQPPGIGVQGIGFLDANHGFIGGFFFGMWETTDGGTTWNRIQAQDRLINRFEKVGGVMYSASSSRGVLRYGPVAGTR